MGISSTPVTKKDTPIAACSLGTGNEIEIGRVFKRSNYDIPYFVTDNYKVSKIYGWRVKKNIYDITNDIYNWFSSSKKTIKKYF